MRVPLLAHCSKFFIYLIVLDFSSFSKSVVLYLCCFSCISLRIHDEHFCRCVFTTDKFLLKCVLKKKKKKMWSTSLKKGVAWQQWPLKKGQTGFSWRFFSIFAAKFPDYLPKHSTEKLPPALLERAFQYSGSTDIYIYILMMGIIDLVHCFTKYGTVPVQIPQLVCKVILGPIRWIFVILKVMYLFKWILENIISSST